MMCDLSRYDGFFVREVIIAFWRIVLMRDGPQDLPDSRPLLLTAALSYAAVSLLGYLISALAEPAESLSIAVVILRLLFAVCADLAFMLGFMWLLLFYFGRLGRFRQSVTAVFGTGAIFSALVLPCMLTVLLAAVMPEGAAVANLLAFVALIGLVLLVLWSLAVFAHILAHTLSKSFGIGVALAALSFFLNYQMFQYLVPGF